jgi:hypothetical protein
MPGKHTPPGDRSFVVSLATHLSAGVALVLVVAGAFWGLGQIQATSAGDPTITPPEIAAGDETPAPEGTPPATEPSEPVEPDTTDEPDETEPADGEPADEPENGENGEVRAFEPSEISVQVLDAAGDGGARMQALVAELRADGYRVVATGQARRIYERSTIFYSDGAQEKAWFVSSEYPALTIVEEKPSTLTSSVEVHIVVGEDYPEP